MYLLTSFRVPLTSLHQHHSGSSRQVGKDTVSSVEVGGNEFLFFSDSFMSPEAFFIGAEEQFIFTFWQVYWIIREGLSRVQIEYIS